MLSIFSLPGEVSIETVFSWISSSNKLPALSPTPEIKKRHRKGENEKKRNEERKIVGKRAEKKTSEGDGEKSEEVKRRKKER